MDYIMKINVSFEYDHTDIAKLVRFATLHGYQRTNPKLAWGEKETKEAARYAIRILVNKEIKGCAT